MLKKITLIGEQKKVLFLSPTNPIQIKGVAGSGKTTVALYRAKHLLETQANLFKETKIVIFTYNKTLAAYITAIKPYISGGYQKDSDEIKPQTPDGLNVQIINFHSWAYHFAGIQFDQTIMQGKQIQIIGLIINKLSSNSSNILEKSSEFFQEEISWMKGKLFQTKDEYLEAARTGRGTSDRVTKADKEVIWVVFERYNQELKRLGKVDFDDYAILALRKIENDSNFAPPYSHIIIDEAQDLNKAQILTISKLVDEQTNSLSIIADAAQRIFKSGFVWSEVGINVRGGRTIEFKKNYRNSVHIARAALSLLDKEQDKSEFTTVETAMKGGEKPKIGYYSDFLGQMESVNAQLKSLKSSNQLQNTVILHRSTSGVNKIKGYLDNNGYSTELVKSNLPVNYGSESIKICTMSSVKGLEFNNVFLLDLNDDIIPYPPGFIEADDEYHISTERRLLYTCMTRARNTLFLFSSDSSNSTRFLKEINPKLTDDISQKKTEVELFLTFKDSILKNNYSTVIPFRKENAWVLYNVIDKRFVSGTFKSYLRNKEYILCFDENNFCTLFKNEQKCCQFYWVQNINLHFKILDNNKIILWKSHPIYGRKYIESWKPILERVLDLSGNKISYEVSYEELTKFSNNIKNSKISYKDTSWNLYNGSLYYNYQQKLDKGNFEEIVVGKFYYGFALVENLIDVDPEFGVISEIIGFIDLYGNHYWE